MKALIQRVSSASVEVDGAVEGKIGAGLLVLLGVEKGDKESDLDKLKDKILNLRIFNDESGKMNKSIIESGGEILLISQFTLLADTSGGRRPSYTMAEDPGKAEEMYNMMADKLKSSIKVETGVFGAYMSVSLINDGPVTIMLDTKEI